MMRSLAPHIVADEEVRFGKPVVEGTRVAVESVLGHLAAGMSPEAVAREYDITREDVLACVAYAARAISEERARATS